MASAQTPATTSAAEQPRRPRFEDIDVPKLWMEEPDESSRWRIRALVTGSIIFHIILLLTSPLWLRAIPHMAPVEIVNAEQWLKDRNLTYIDEPNTAPPPKTKPDTNVISDRDRIAQSRQPELNRDELKKIIDSSRPGAPGQPAAPAAPPAPPTPAVAASQGQHAPAASPPPDQQTTAKLENLPNPGPRRPRGAFDTGSPESTIEQASRAAAAARAGGVSGSGGDYGLGVQKNAGIASGFEVLSDTMGVDFGPYLQRVLHDVRENWYNIIPEAARPPLMKKGKVAIEFAITRDGRVAGLKLDSSSGDVALDRAAWGGITGSNPFPPLPPEFKGQYIALRFRFFYNPDKSDLQ